ncbi:MAG: 4-alpha-glucanotransferase, partial [Paludibacter sp.]|nr:4-alpha-glucanotransferase [Paludibacter sp.]
MKIQFNIHYITQWGESLYLLLYNPEESTIKEPKSIVMQFNDKFEWTIEITLDSSVSSVLYQYALLNSDKTFKREYGAIRKVEFDTTHENIKIQDYWRSSFGDSPFTSAAFTNCFFKRKEITPVLNPEDANLILRLNCPQLEPERHIAIIGNQKALGNWDEKGKVRLDETNFPIWSISFNAQQFTFPLEYKFLIVDTKTDKVLAWGGGPNRILKSSSQKKLSVITEEHFLRTIPSWKGAGVAIPVFSLRSGEGFGVGEFNDLKKMVDWAKKTGQRIIQTLPINDTILYHTNYDSYPYNAVSVHALHP